MRYSLIVPVYNNENGLNQLIDAIYSVDFLSIDSEVILVDDASSDGTWKKMNALKSMHPELKIMRLARNFGQHGATLAGISESSGDWVFTLDDDLEVHPSEFSHLLKSQEKSAALVVYGEYNARQSTFRKLTKSLYKTLAKSEGKLKGKGSSMRIIQGELARKIAKTHHSFVFIDEFILWYTDHVEFVQVSNYKQAITKTRYKLSGLFRTTLNVMMYSTALPLRLVTLTGFILASVNFLIGIFLVYKYFFDKIKIEGYVSLMVAVLFSTGLLLIGIGVIAQYLRNMMKNLNHAPAFYVAEKQC